MQTGCILIRKIPLSERIDKVFTSLGASVDSKTHRHTHTHPSFPHLGIPESDVLFYSRTGFLSVPIASLLKLTRLMSLSGVVAHPLNVTCLMIKLTNDQFAYNFVFKFNNLNHF